VADLRLPADSFGAVYAMNCLVHVPKAQLRGVLEGISRVIKPGGLFYLGIYGGREFEGVWDGDYFEPKRFFCHHLDEELCSLVGAYFRLENVSANSARLERAALPVVDPQKTARGGSAWLNRCDPSSLAKGSRGIRTLPAGSEPRALGGVRRM
jgi:SAM-dependent methyltransferase